MKLGIINSFAPIVIGFSYLIGCSPVSIPPAPDMAAGVYVQSGYKFYRWGEGLSIMIWHDGISS